MSSNDSVCFTADEGRRKDLRKVAELSDRCDSDQGYDSLQSMENRSITESYPIHNRDQRYPGYDSSERFVPTEMVKQLNISAGEDEGRHISEESGYGGSDSCFSEPSSISTASSVDGFAQTKVKNRANISEDSITKSKDKVKLQQQSKDSGYGNSDLGFSKPNSVNSSKGTFLDPIHAFAQTGDIHYIFVNFWRQFFVQNQDGDTSLHLAVIHCQESALNPILNVLPKPEYLDIYNDLTQTALHLAVAVRKPKFVEKLLDCGANVTLPDRNGQTCLHLACQRGDLKVVRAIVKPRPNRPDFNEDIQEVLETRNFEGLTPLHIAVLKNNLDIAKMLEPIKALNLIQLLVSLGADVNARTGKSGYTSLHLAVEQNNLPIISYLLFETNTDINAVSYSDCTALHLAAGLGLVDIVALLVAAGADQTIENVEGEMACDIACDDFSDILDYPFDDMED